MLNHNLTKTQICEVANSLQISTQGKKTEIADRVAEYLAENPEANNQLLAQFDFLTPSAPPTDEASNKQTEDKILSAPPADKASNEQAEESPKTGRHPLENECPICKSPVFVIDSRIQGSTRVRIYKCTNPLSHTYRKFSNA